MLHSVVLLVLGLVVAVSGMGLTLSFGVLAFVGMPLLLVGLGLISAATDSLSRRTV